MASQTRPTWHSPADQALRKEMLNNIMRVLRSQGSNAPPNWLQKLPEMAHRLEDECYRIATSREEYANPNTLQTRLKNIVRAAQKHQHVNRTAAAPTTASSTTASATTTPVAGGGKASTDATPIPFPSTQAVAPPPSLAGSASKATASKGQDVPQAIPMPPDLQDDPKQPKKAAEAGPSASTASSIIDALMSDKVSMPESSISPLVHAQTADAANSAAAIAAANRSRSAQIIRQFKAQAQKVTSALDQTQTTEYHNKLKSMTSSDIKTANSKEVLQRQQQRLLLLRHAMWCKASEGACTATPSCGEMKRLWQHMGACQHTNSCSYSHCISSKYVLSHFQQCTNPMCLVCQVVRYPVEVKEKNGQLMLDADRALQQIYAVTQRRQLQNRAQVSPAAAAPSQQQPQLPSAPLQQQMGPQVPQPPLAAPLPIPMPPQLQQTGPPMASPLNNGAMSYSVGGAGAGTMLNAGANVGPSSQQFHGGGGGGGVVSQGPVATTPNAAANSSDAFVASLTEEDRRQLAIIQQKLLGWSLEQLNDHCKKLESLAEQIRTQMNSIMNECRQLLQRSNTTQDVAVKGQLERQVNEKRATLKSLDVKYKRCNTQRRIVKHIISTRTSSNSGVPFNPSPVATAAGGPLHHQPLQQLPASAMLPIPMPPSIQQSGPPVIPPPPPQVQSQAFGSQLSMPQNMTRMPPHQQQQQPRVAQTVVKPSPDDLLAEESQMPMGAADVAGTPIGFPADLQEPSTAMTASATPLQQHQQSIKQEMPSAALVAESSVQLHALPQRRPADDATNPLTMNNSKLNAMMKEHRRMDSAKALKAEKDEDDATPSASNALNASPSAVEKLDISVSSAMVPVSLAGTPSSTATAAEAPTSMLNELSNVDLKAHIDSLVMYYNATMPPAQLKKRLEGLLKGMMEHKFGWVFSSPVDPVALEIPNYFKIIRRPMDLGTIKKKLDLGIYKNLHQFATDVRLTFGNAMTYNNEEQDVYNLAKDMLADFNAELRKLEVEVSAEEAAVREKESSCRLCGVERMVFEPAVLYCNGECNSRIRRNCYYYVSPDNKYHCCHPCHGTIGDTVKHSEGRVYKKAELSRKKNDEVHEEPWVQCDSCNRWVHQICALFNGKIDAEKKPQQVKTESAKGTTPAAGGSSSNSSSAGSGTGSSASASASASSTPSHAGGNVVPAHSISSTPGSEFLCPECLLEHRQQEPQKYKIGRHAFNAKDLMRTKLSDHLERRIYKALQDEREDEAKWTNKDASTIETAEALTVRQVSNIEKQLMVRDKMFQRYKDSHKYTYEHRFKSKCICMFQEIHGVSVLLFGMYVHEFDEQEAECNARRVYISYLDSVNYFEPPHLRTKVYHELLIAYMDFVKQLGFHTAHLWACPPLKGDDYILYCHPESQKTPKSDRLRQWYVDMLVKAQAEDVVWQITNMYDEYWRDDLSACVLPYFEGDYWVGLAEDLIEKIEAEKPKKAPKKPAAAKRKTAETTKRGSKKSKAKKPKRRKTGVAGIEADAGGDGGNGSDGDGGGDDDNDDDTGGEDEGGGSEKAKKETPLTSLDAVDRTVTDPLMVKLGEVIEPMKDDFLVVKLHPSCRVCNTTVLQGVTWQDPRTKTDVCLNPKVVQTVLCDACYQRAKLTPKLLPRLKPLVRTEMHIPLKITDPDEVKDSEFFDTRQAFLSLCQGNHYQFDELRRAKHSSMMALYHLGNPNPNAYIYECNACTQDIVAGNRWHCHACPDFDVCDACYEKEKHEHPLEMIPTSGVGAVGGHSGGPGGSSGPGGSGPALTEEQRRLREHRAKNVRLHMQLLVHSSSCADGNCGSSNCEKMKELMRHGAQCKLRAYGGCTICRRVWALLQLHARQCRQYECKVPRCHDLREHVRKLQLQQQLMDDRRRAAVTQQYRQLQGGGGDGGGDSEQQANGGDGDDPMTGA